MQGLTTAFIDCVLTLSVLCIHGTCLLSPAECVGSGISRAGPMAGHQHVPPGSAIII